MKFVRLCIAATLTAGAFVRPAAGQIGVAAHVGTLGIGADISIGLLPVVAIRAGGNFQPWEPTLDFDDIEYTITLASPTGFGVIDLYIAGPLRISGGAVYFSDDTEVNTEIKETVDIGGVSYGPQQITSLGGIFEARKLAPYAGIGFGKAPRTKGVGFVMDLGVAFHGEPTVSLSAMGPFASDPTFQSHLMQEESNITEDAKSLRFYPVASVGFVIVF